MGKVRIYPDGTIQMIYTDALDLSRIGRAKTSRASHVEPTEDGRWTADLSPVGGPTLGPYRLRSEALAAEVQWLNQKLSEDGLKGGRNE